MGLQNWWVSSQIKIGRGVDWRTSWKSYGNRDDWSEEGEWQAKICPHWRQCIVSRRAGSESGRATTTTMRQISREISVPKSSVLRIVHDDLSLKCVKKRRAQEHSIKSSCSPATRQKAAANVLKWQSELYLVHRWESFHGVYRVFTEESAKWPSVRSGRHQEEAGRGWASVAYANNVQSVGDGVGRCLKAWLHRSDFCWPRGEG